MSDRPLRVALVLVVGLFLLLSLAGRSDAAPATVRAVAPAISSYTVLGFVSDSQTLAAVGGAAVRSGTGPSTTTSPSGAYSLLLPAGPQTLTASALGYHKGSTPVNVRANVSDVNFSLVPYEFVVSGSILDRSTFAPIANASVMVPVAHLSVTGSPAGTYRLTLENGSFAIIVSASGYLSQQATVTVLGASVVQNFPMDRAPLPPREGGGTAPAPLTLVALGVLGGGMVGAVAFLFETQRAARTRVASSTLAGLVGERRRRRFFGRHRDDPESPPMYSRRRR